MLIRSDVNRNEYNMTNPTTGYERKLTKEQEVRHVLTEEVAAILKSTLPIALAEALKVVSLEKNETEGGKDKEENKLVKENENYDTDGELQGM
ncbi:hypothetical protein L1987_54124 [Smallanthus sonchifolius]|uniref:Uncharacterized protein n=1 Tax=Smallanthus sonchifolius TaxID=185202 RepID=A0ACB9E6D4_9ASTR|nr:hypothetical protein L1987_54124 [Smallanthus sonchifolius]